MVFGFGVVALGGIVSELFGAVAGDHDDGSVAARVAEVFTFGATLLFPVFWVVVKVRRSG